MVPTDYPYEGYDSQSASSWGADYTRAGHWWDWLNWDTFLAESRIWLPEDLARTLGRGFPTHTGHRLEVVAERQMSWDTFLAENPGIAALGGFPTHTAIPEVDAQL